TEPSIPPTVAAQIATAQRLTSPSAAAAQLPASQATASQATVRQSLPPADPLPAFSAFSDWASQFLSGKPGISVAQGEALAWKRREEMLDLIEHDPQKALALAAPF